MFVYFLLESFLICFLIFLEVVILPLVKLKMPQDFLGSAEVISAWIEKFQ